jgi:hypothetical protein
MRSTPIFKLMQRYVDPVFIEIPPCPPGRSGCEHMGVGHSLASQYAYNDDAYAVFLTPDSMMSDGSVARLQTLAARGVTIVLAAALRFAEEAFLGNLAAVGAIPESSRRDSAAPLTIDSRTMVHAAINGFHGEVLGYNWEAPQLVLVPAATWWRVPNEDGVLIHSLSWAPVLLDYGSVDHHDTSTFDTWTLDGDYVSRNIHADSRTYVIQDSDEVFLASWTPMAEGPTPIPRSWLLKFAPLREAIRGALLYRTFNSYITDPLKRAIFDYPVRWHARPLNPAWDEIEHEASAVLRAYLPPRQAPNFMIAPPVVSDPSAGAPKPSVLKQAFNAIARLGVGVGYPVIQAWVYRVAVRRRLAQALSGDATAYRRIVWHLRSTMSYLLGRSFHEPPPKLPQQERN